MQFEHFYVNMNIIYKKYIGGSLMFGNNMMPEAYANIPSDVSAEGKSKGKAAGVYKISCSDFDMCKLQYYDPQPIVGARLAHAYVPFQCLCCLYPPLLGLKQGTIFPELDRPYGADPAYSYDG